MIKWLRSRLDDLRPWRWVPRERRILQLIRLHTDVWLALGALTSYLLAETWLKPALAVLTACGFTIVLHIVLADFIENKLRKAILGVAYNPNMWAMQEWEGGMFPTEPQFEAQWRAEINLVRAPWWGEKIGGE